MIWYVLSRFSNSPHWLLRDPWQLKFGWNSFGPVPLSIAEKDQGCIATISPYQWLAKWEMGLLESSLGFQQETASCTVDLYVHESKICHVELTSSCCCWAADGLHGTDTRIITIAGHSITTTIPLHGGTAAFLRPLLASSGNFWQALLDCYIHTRLGETVAAVSVPGQSGREVTLQLKTYHKEAWVEWHWSCPLSMIEATWNKCQLIKCWVAADLLPFMQSYNLTQI